MDSHTCDKHMTPTQREAVDHRSIFQKRCGLELGQIVVETEEHKKMFGRSGCKFNGGKIVDFKDPYSWDGKTASSLASVECLCGCIEGISTAWLKAK